MDSNKEYLHRLLYKDEWTMKDKGWLMQYLEHNDLSELKMIAREYYNNDLSGIKNAFNNKLSGKTLKSIHERIGARGIKYAKVFSIYSISVAAAVILIVSVMLFKGESISDMLRPVHMLEAATSADERKIIRLHDGSVIYMEGNSLLRYPDKFYKGERNVSLKGEAFFDIAKDENRPFIIHSPLFNTTVLGTSFEVIDDSSNAKVVVTTGTVKVQAAQSEVQQQLTLSETDAALLNSNNQVLQKKSLPEEARYYSQRKDGKFVYRDIPVMTVAKDIELYFKTTLLMDDEMKQRLFTGSFKTSDNLDKVIKIIAITMNANVREPEPNVYRITGGKNK